MSINQNNLSAAITAVGLGCKIFFNDDKGVSQELRLEDLPKALLSKDIDIRSEFFNYFDYHPDYYDYKIKDEYLGEGYRQITRKEYEKARGKASAFPKGTEVLVVAPNAGRPIKWSPIDGQPDYSFNSVLRTPIT